MSVWAQSWAYEQRIGQWRTNKKGEQAWKGDAGAKSVLTACATFADESGYLYAGQDTLAQMCEMSNRTVREHLYNLEHTYKKIRREPRRRKDGGYTSDGTWLLAPVSRLRPPRPGDKDIEEGSQPEESFTKEKRQQRKPVDDPAADSATRPAADSATEPLVIEPSGTSNDSSLRSSSLSGVPQNEKKQGRTDEKKHVGKNCMKQLMDLVNQYREQGYNIYDPPDMGRTGARFKQLGKHENTETLESAVQFMAEKAAGIIEGEPKAWCGPDRALDMVKTLGDAAFKYNEAAIQEAAPYSEHIETTLEDVAHSFFESQRRKPPERRRILPEDRSRMDRYGFTVSDIWPGEEHTVYETSPLYPEGHQHGS